MPGVRRVVIPALLVTMLCVPATPALSQDAPEPVDRPRGGLFSEEGPSGGGLSLAWFVLGLYVLAGLIFAGACAHLAVHKALPPLPWFFLGLFLNAVGYLILLTRAPGDAQPFRAGIPRGLRKVPRTYFAEDCPECGNHNHPAAHYCPGCGSRMEPPFESEAARWRKSRHH